MIGPELQVEDFLPHRYPFLFVDRVIALEGGRSVDGLYQVNAAHPLLNHSGEQPLFPSLLLVEALGQVAALAMDARDRWWPLVSGGRKGSWCALTIADLTIVAWDKPGYRLAEICGKYLSKGRQVYVEGKLQTHSFDDKEGVKRYVTEIIAQDVQFLGGKGDASDPARSGGGRRPSANRAAGAGPPAGTMTSRFDGD